MLGGDLKLARNIISDKLSEKAVVAIIHKVNKDSNFSSLIGSKLLFFHIFALDLCFNATLAQLVEQRIRNAWVAGSSPAGGSWKF